MEYIRCSLGLDHLSLKGLRGEGLGERGAPSLGTLEDMLINALNTNISLHKGPFKTNWNLEGGKYTGNFKR